MPYLVLNESDSRQRLVPISDDRLMIGRHEDNDVVLNDKAVSGRHALIGRSGGDVVIEDLNSTNGVQVNGAAVMRHVLAEGDRIVIGRNGFVFRAGEAPDAAAVSAAAEPPLPDAGAAASAPVRPTSPELSLMEDAAPAAPTLPEPPPLAAPPSVDDPASAPSLIDDASPAPAPAPRVARLEVLSGAAAGRRMELSKPLNTLGKAGVQVVAVRRDRDDLYVLVAVEGPPPTLNGAPLPAGAPPLQSGDVIGLGSVTLRFVLE